MGFFKFTGKTILTALMVSVLALFFGILVHESYSTGKAVESRNKIIQTIAILDLTAENDNLKSTIITINGENATLRIITQTQQEEIDNLKSTVTSLNSSLTSLRNEKEATDEVVSNLQNDIAYLNEYIAELEEELSQFRNNVLVIYLPQDMNTCDAICAVRLTEDIVILSDTLQSSTKDVYAYTISTRSFKKIYEGGGALYKEIISPSDNIKLIVSRGGYGGIISYNLVTKEYSVVLSRYASYSLYVVHIDENRKICLLSLGRSLYEYNYETEIVTKYEGSIVVDSVLYVKNSFVYFSGRYESGANYGIFKVNIEERTFEKFDGGYFNKYFKISDTKVVSGGYSSASSANCGLWLFDFETDTMTRIIETGGEFSSFMLLNNYLFCSTIKLVHRIDLDTLEYISNTVTFPSKIVYKEVQNGVFMYNEDGYSGLYYWDNNLSELTSLLTSGYAYRFYFEYNNGYFISSIATTAKGLYYFSNETDSITTIYSSCCYYDKMFDIGDKLLFYTSLSSTQNAQMYNILLVDKETFECQVVRGSVYCVYDVVESEDHYIIISYVGVYKLLKNDYSCSQISNFNHWTISKKLDDGNYLMTCRTYPGTTYLLDIQTGKMTVYSVDVELEDVA